MDTFVHRPGRFMLFVVVKTDVSVLLLNARRTWLESLEIDSIRVHQGLGGSKDVGNQTIKEID